jgi:putative transposase
MPRESRVVCSDYPYHVTQRGNYRQNVFEDDEDREVYMNYFMEYKEKFGVKLFAYCLMDNHVHFIVEPSTESGLAKLFSVVHMRYSQHFNKKKGVRGQLWQGRFFSCPLDKEHLYEAIRYVELNPLRAGITSSIEAYSWSSLQGHLLGKGRYPVDDLSEYLEIDDWKTYLSESINEDVLATLRERTKTNRPAGNASFIKELEHLSGKTFNLAGRGRPRKKVGEVK